MNVWLSAAGRAALRAFGAALLVYGLGVLAAPDLNQAYLIAIAAIVAGVAAVCRSLLAALPGLSLTRYLGEPYGDWADSFLQAFLGSLAATLSSPELGSTLDLSTVRTFLAAAVVGAFGAGGRALQGLLTSGESPKPARGVREPRKP